MRAWAAVYHDLAQRRSGQDREILLALAAPKLGTSSIG